MTSWKHGAVVYPLSTQTTRSLLQDADPALYEAREFLVAMLETYLGPRLQAQGVREGRAFPRAVGHSLVIPLSPAVLAESFQFPLFAIYRRTETNGEHTLTYDGAVGEWEFVYALPPLTARQTNELAPVLRSATRVIARALTAGRDASYRDGAEVLSAAGIYRARLVSAAYGNFEMESPNGAFSAVTGRIEVTEREQSYTDEDPTFVAVDLAEDLAEAGADDLADVVDASSDAPN